MTTNLSQSDIDYNFEKLKDAVIIEYEETWTRNKALEDKISKFLTTLSIVFIAYIYLITASTTWELLKQANLALKLLVIINLILYLLISSNCIIHCLNAFKLKEFKRIQSFYLYEQRVGNIPPSQFNWELYYNYNLSREYNHDILVEKTQIIDKALKSLKLSTLILSINIFILMIAFIGKHI